MQWLTFPISKIIIGRKHLLLSSTKSENKNAYFILSPVDLHRSQQTKLLSFDLSNLFNNYNINYYYYYYY